MTTTIRVSRISRFDRFFSELIFLPDFFHATFLVFKRPRNPGGGGGEGVGLGPPSPSP